MRKVYLLFMSFGLAFPMLALADTTQSMSQSTTTPAAPQSNFKYSGYLDGSYNYLVRSNQFTSGTFDRVYDLEPNGGVAEILVKKG